MSEELLFNQEYEQSNDTSILNSIQPYLSWGSATNTSIEPFHGSKSSYSTPKQLIQRIGCHYFLYIVGCRVVLYDMNAQSSTSNRLAGNPIQFLQSHSNIEFYQSIHLSYPKEKYLLCIVSLKDDKDKNIASLAIYDFSHHNTTSGNIQNYSNIVPRILRYQGNNSSRGLASSSTSNTSGGNSVAYQFVTISYSSDGSHFAACTNDVHDGALLFHTSSVISNIISSPHEYIIPLRSIPVTNLLSKVSFHPTDTNKFCVSGSDFMLSYWRYTANTMRSSPVSIENHQVGNTSYSSSFGSSNISNQVSISVDITCHEWIGEKMMLAGDSLGNLYLAQGCEVISTAKNIFLNEDSVATSTSFCPVSNLLYRQNVVICACYPMGLISIFEVKKYMSSSRQTVAAKLIPFIKHRLMPYETILSHPLEFNHSNSTLDKGMSIESIDWVYSEDRDRDRDRSIDEIVIVTRHSIAIYDLKTSQSNKQKIVERLSHTNSNNNNSNIISNQKTQTIMSNSFDSSNVPTREVSPKSNLLVTGLMDIPTISVEEETDFEKNHCIHSIVEANMSLISDIHKTYPKKVLSLFHSSHHISSFNLSSRGSSFLSCSNIDNTIHVRNYLGLDEVFDRSQLISYPISNPSDDTNISSDPIQPFNHPISCSLHPSGQYIAIGGEEKVVEYAIADTNLKPLKQILLKTPFYLTTSNGSSSSSSNDSSNGNGSLDPQISSQPASIVSYSHSGHLLAIGTGKTLRVYNTQRLDYHNLSREGIPSLIFASNEHTYSINDIRFSGDDSCIISSGNDGYVYAYDLMTSRRVSDYCLKGFVPKVLALGSPASITTYGRSFLSNSISDGNNMGRMDTNAAILVALQPLVADSTSINANMSLRQNSIIRSGSIHITPNELIHSDQRPGSPISQQGRLSSQSNRLMLSSIGRQSSAFGLGIGLGVGSGVGIESNSQSKPFYIAVWKASKSSNISNIIGNYSHKKDQVIFNNQNDQSNHKIKDDGNVKMISSVSSLLTPYPELIATESLVVSATIGWTTDGMFRTEICMLGYDDGRVLICCLPFPVKIISSPNSNPFFPTPILQNNLPLIPPTVVPVVSTNTSVKIHTFANTNTNTKGQISHGNNVNNNSSSIKEPNQKYSRRNSSISQQTIIDFTSLDGRGSESVISDERSSPSTNKSLMKSFRILSENRCKVIPLHTKSVAFVAISSSGHFLFSAGLDGSIHMLSLGLNSLSPAITNATAAITIDNITNSSGSSSNNMNTLSNLSVLSMNKGTEMMIGMSIGMNGQSVSLPEAIENADNEYVLSDRKVYKSMRHRIQSIDSELLAIHNAHGLRIKELENLIMDQRIGSDDKLRNEIGKRDAIIVKYMNDIISLQKQMKDELDAKEREYREKYRDLEMDYEKRLLQEHQHNLALKQAYDEYVADVRLDLKDREKLKDKQLEDVIQNKKKYEDEVDRQQKVMNLYVSYLNDRNQEIFEGLETKQIEERHQILSDLSTTKQTLEEQQQAMKTATIHYQTIQQKAKFEIQQRDEKIIELEAELHKAKNRIDSLDKERIGLRLDIETMKTSANRWESKAKEHQTLVNDLEKTRKSLTMQLHELRQEMNPKEAKLLKVSDKLAEMESEYISICQKLTEKEKYSNHLTETLSSVQKQLRDIRKQSAHRDMTLHRAAKLFEDYRLHLKQAGEGLGDGHKAMFRANLRANSSLLPSTISSSILSIAVPNKNVENKTVDNMNGNGKAMEDLDLTFGRIYDLLQRYILADTNESNTLEDEEMADEKNERERHIHYLHSSIAGLKTNLKHSQTASASEAQKKVQDNKALLLEVNNLRHEIRGMTQDNQRLQATIEFVERRYRKQQEQLLLSSTNRISSPLQIPSRSVLKSYPPSQTIDETSQRIPVAMEDDHPTQQQEQQQSSSLGLGSGSGLGIASLSLSVDGSSDSSYSYDNSDHNSLVSKNSSSYTGSVGLKGSKKEKIMKTMKKKSNKSLLSSSSFSTSSSLSRKKDSISSSNSTHRLLDPIQKSISIVDAILTNDDFINSNPRSVSSVINDETPIDSSATSSAVSSARSNRSNNNPSLLFPSIHE